ncbi:MAG: hypothetical protein ABSG36_03355 [Acidimicrobiales bacterium]|jgi:type II secretory pathway pseudopilin PulG
MSSRTDSCHTTGSGHLPVEQARRPFADYLRRRLADRDDSGQALVIIVVILVLLVALAPLMARQITTDAPLLAQATDSHAALAAAEAGIQWYRDNLDSYPNYYVYSSTNNPLNDPAMSPNWCGAGQSSSCDLSGTNPAEAFNYSPSDTNLFSQSGNQAGTVQLIVTGRAGARGNYSYVYAEATFSTNSLLDDAYYSNFEVLDPNSQTIQEDNVTATISGGTGISEPETTAIVGSYLDHSGATVTVSPAESPWQLACLYDTYQVNTFVDALQLTIGGTTYSSSHPYYGPFLSNSNFSFTMPSPTTTVQMPTLPCEAPYDFVNGETFNGPVYTNDQLHVCGSPAFNGSPVSLTSGAPSNLVYAYQVPGSVPVGTNQYGPAGYTTDEVNCGGQGKDTPTLKNPVQLDGQQSLPTLNSSLAKYGTSTPPTGAGYGCTYEGPTMIELVYSAGAETMDVWSPLSTDTSTTTSACSGGSTFSASQPFITGIPIPTDGVVYVENFLGAPPSALDTSSYDGSGPCFNPYQSALPFNNPDCEEGDVYLEGELKGQLTVASQANIMITRDLTYQCADGAGGASLSNPSSVPLCTNETTPDILGLSAKYEDLISGNNGNAGNTNCTSAGYGNGTGTPTNSGTVIGGTNYPNDPAAVWPTVCNPDNVIIDSAIFGVQGSFGVENWGTTPQSGNANLNGSDLSEFRGPFGYVGSTGYYKEFSFDQRLAYVTPPHILPAGIPLWQQTNFVLCPDSNGTNCPQIG